jgi:DNA-binding MarR family transcriptional regulator
VRRELQRILREAELSVAAYTTLSVLRARPGLSNAQLARRALMTAQSMNEVVWALERRRLVKRTVDPRHGRILRTELTRRGSKILDKLEPGIAQMQDEMLSGLGPDQRKGLLDGLMVCMQNLSKGRN